MNLRIPLITGTAPKRQKTDQLSNAFTDAARAVARAFSPPATPEASTSAVGISPGKGVELRGKNFQQLRYLQQLYDDNVLTDTEYTEQKNMILEALRKLK